MTSPSDRDGGSPVTGDSPVDGDPRQDGQSDWDSVLREAVDWSILLDDAPDDLELRARFEAWRAEDPLHDRAWQETTHASRLIAQTRNATSPDRTKKRTVPTLDKTKIGRRAGTLVALAAAVVIAWLAGPQLMLSITADYVTGTAEQRMVTLPDGSTVRLAPASAMRFIDAAEARGVTILSGEAYFDVTRDPARPFTVTAQETTVTVLGTGFNVRLGEETTDIAVRHGRVRVDAGNGGKKTLILEAGRWARVSGDGRAGSGALDPDAVGGWTESRIIAVDRRLSEVLADLRRYYSGAIVLTGDALAGRSVTGVFDVSDPAAAARVIVRPHGGSVRRITPWLLVISPS